MIRRKSTIDIAQRQKRTKLVQMFNILDLCLQVPSDDRLLIRNQIKNNNNQQLMDRIYRCKRDKNYHQLQIWLRKYVAKMKQNDKYGMSNGMMKPNNNRGKTPSTIKSTKNPTETSYHSSLKNSMHSSPSAKKQNTKIQMSKSQIQKHIENQINKEIKRGIQKEQCQVQRKDITPRDLCRDIFKQNQNHEKISDSINNSHNLSHYIIEKKCDKFNQFTGQDKQQRNYEFSKRISQNIRSQPIINMKNTLKSKLIQRQKPSLTYQRFDNDKFNINTQKQNCNAYLKNQQSLNFTKPKAPPLTLIISNHHNIMGNNNNSMNTSFNSNSNMSSSVITNYKNWNIEYLQKIKQKQKEKEKEKQKQKQRYVQKQKQNQDTKYGQFYRRIKKVIEQSS